MSDRSPSLDSSIKQSILVLAGVYLPGFLAGGPVRSIAGLVDRLGDEFQWRIITTNRDLHSTTPYPEVPTNCWVRVGKADVWYAASGRDRAFDLVRLIRNTPHDLIYLNSFFSPRFAIAPVLARRFGKLPKTPMLISPRGELSAGALALKACKKAVYLNIARAFGLYRDVRWRASSRFEQGDIERALKAPQERINVAADLAVSRSGLRPRTRPARNPLKVCFLSRISRMKNLDFALKVMAFTRQPIQFTVYGPKEDQEYWNECVALISILPRHVSVIYGGQVHADDVPSVLMEQDVFFLPTRGENFGHALIEAWEAGLPVLTSDQTQWRDLATKGVGWDLPLGDDSLPKFAERLDALARCPADSFIAMRDRAIQFGTAITDNTVAIENNKQAFLAAMDSGESLT